MLNFTSQTKELEGEIEAYLHLVQTTGLIFNEALKDYLNDSLEDFLVRVAEISQAEHEADEVRREIKFKLYTKMLIPESRGDVLGLLESIDEVVDQAKFIVTNLDIQKPDIPKFLVNDFLKIAEFSQKAMDEMVFAARAFFVELKRVNDHIGKVNFYEKEIDKLEDRMKREIFSTSELTKLSERIQLRYFTEKTADLSDAAESVCDRLSIYAIKRLL